MIVVGLTGGIGSGKTTVAKAFKALGIPIYIADIEAKKLMNRSKVIKRKLKLLLGEAAYTDAGKLNKPYIANIIFNDESYLKKMNAIVHPKVAKHFKKWTEKQSAPYVIKEVAVLFENGGNTACDFVITVTAPKALRIERLLKRDNTSTEKIEAIIKNQWSDSEKIKLSDYTIINKTLEYTILQAKKVHKKILCQIQ
ncbi:dephospho-CoA kinase [Hyunsoonleella sp. 2307UL5-6]|uniref:dephospho-CoA kinase n=1 Tax=Hyunsoonleella sp. 2307UL5-6 TaxID=3384768 RepID=UPI0039BD1ED3